MSHFKEGVMVKKAKKTTAKKSSPKSAEKLKVKMKKGGTGGACGTC
jgi:hypothetical protein